MIITIMYKITITPITTPTTKLHLLFHAYAFVMNFILIIHAHLYQKKTEPAIATSATDWNRE